MELAKEKNVMHISFSLFSTNRILTRKNVLYFGLLNSVGELSYRYTQPHFH